MSPLSHIAFAALVTTLGTTNLFAQTITPEIEPNGDKTEATVVVGMAAGDCITGHSAGATTGAGNSAANTADYWDITTAAQATPGWYRWQLTLTPSNRMTIRGLSQTGTVGMGATPNPGSDNTVQTDLNLMLAWYSNETPSRIFVRVTGLALTAPPSYTACLSCTLVAATPVSGNFSGGMIRVTTDGLTTFDTDLAIADSTRTIIPGYLNDDQLNTLVLQSDLTRMYTSGTYYVVITDYDHNTSEPAPFDDDFVGGEVMDFPNVHANSATSSTDDLTFLIDDGQGSAVVTPAFKSQPFEILFFAFTVGAAALPESCNGDGGDQMGCTACPCGNEAAPGTVGGCSNSAGTSTRLLGSGTSSIAAMDLRFEASGAPPQNSCQLTSGNALAPANMTNPCFGLNSGIQSVSLDGLRCVVQGVLRHGVRPSDASGNVGVTTNGWGTPNGFFNFGAFVAGSTKHFQIINRDNAAAVCTTGQNTSQAVSVVFTM